MHVTLQAKFDCSTPFPYVKKQQQNPLKQLFYSFCQLYSPTDDADILFSITNSALVSHSNHDL